MALFLRVAAVLAGLANMLLFSLAGDGELGNLFVWNLDPWWPDNFLYAIYAIIVGIVTSSILLKFAYQSLQSGFFARYSVMVLAVCFGGVLLSVFSTIVANLSDDHLLTVTKRVTWALPMMPFAAVAGGVLGVAEGVILAFPLALVLGLFRDRTTSSHTGNTS